MLKTLFAKGRDIFSTIESAGDDYHTVSSKIGSSFLLFYQALLGVEGYCDSCLLNSSLM